MRRSGHGSDLPDEPCPPVRREHPLARDPLQALAAAGLQVFAADDLGTTLERTCAEAAHLVGVTGASFFLLDEEGEVISTTHYGPPPGAGRSVHGQDAPPDAAQLSVPVLARGRATGVLNVRGGRDHVFTDDDLQLVQAFAAAVGSAVSHALLVDDLARREQWSMLLSESARNVSSGDDEISMLIGRAAGLAGVALICVVLPTCDHDRLAVSHAVGLGADDLVGLSFPRAESLVGSVIEAGHARTEDDLSRWIDPTLEELRRLSTGLVVPFEIERAGGGALILARERGARRFRFRDLEMADSLAAHVGVLASQVELRRAQRRLVLLEERQRIAQDLHDHVIQRLFAVGLGLDILVSRLDDREVASRLSDLRKEVQGAVTQVRQSVYSLSRTSEPSSLQDRVVEVVGSVRGFVRSPTLAFSGPVDSAGDGSLVDDVVAVVREALTNAVRHGRATTAHVTVVLTDGRLSVTVVNDGAPLHNPVARSEVSGLANMRRRALSRGGTLEITQAKTALGACVRWTVPVVDPHDASE